MTNDEIIDAFLSYFRGRGDCYGSAQGFCVHERLTRDTFARHLTSTNPEDWIGTYCMMNEDCSWGCIDIDGKDFPLMVDDGAGNLTPSDSVWDWNRMWQLAVKLRTMLAVKDIHAHIERTKNGYHVWVFPDQPIVPARAMRRALMAACVAIGYNPNEVNPKAEGPRPGTKGLGNFVRLPYGGYLHDDAAALKRPRVFVDGLQAPMWLQDALTSMQRTSLAALEDVARLWTPPPPPSTEVDMDAGLDAWECVRLLDGKGYTIWKDGPLPGSDRSTTLARLAHLCRERGLLASQAFAVLQSADARWGKFQDRPDQLAYMIERAYE